jgi:hypothetical protein
MTTETQNPGRRVDCMGCKVSLALCERYTHLSEEKVFRLWSVSVGFGRFRSVSVGFGRFQMSFEPIAALRAVC